MKKCKKLLALTMAVLLAFACFALPSFAMSSGSQYGLEATIVTDKESYKANEEIHVTVTVKNTNDFKVEDVSIESLLPETLTLKDGSSSTKTVDLEAGETLTLSFTAVKEKEETSATVPESEGTTPTETETVKPSESETDKPTETETVKPSETETAKPSESETIKPTETQQPSTQESTEQPTQAPTTEKPTQPTTAPITTTTAPFTTEEATTLPSTTGTPSTTGGGIIGDLTTTFPKVTTTADSATTAQAENPNTGDSMSVKTLVIAIIALLAVIAVVIILMYKYKKQTTKIISLVMCVAIAATAITGVSFFTAKGADDGRKSFTVEKVITVDGEETKVNATVKYQEPKEDNSRISEPVKLTCNPKELGTSSNSQKVYFYAETNIKVNYVSLYDADTNNELIRLMDDGSSEGDVKADDGIYSGKIIIPPCKKATTFKYYALIKTDRQEIKSRVRELQVISPFTQEEIQEMDELFNRLEALGSDSFYKMSESKRKKVAEQEFKSLLDDGLVDNYYFYKNDTIIGFTYLNGLPSAFSLEKKDPLLAGRSIESKALNSSSNTISSSTNEIIKTNNTVVGATGKALITYGWDNPLDEKSNWNVYQNVLVKKWGEIGFKTTLHPLPTVLDFRTMFTEQEYKYIVLAEHGDEYPDYNELGTVSPHYAISTGEVTSTDKTSNEYLNDIRSGRIIQLYGNYYLTPSFFSFYYEDKLDNTVIDIESCMNFGNGPFDDDSFATAFIDNCGAEAVIGYHNSVFILYSATVTLNMLINLANNNNNITQALEQAKETCCPNDVEYMYKYGSKRADWLTPDEDGKTPKEKTDEKQAKGEEAYPVLSVKGKVRAKFIDGETKDPVQTEVLVHKDNRYGELYNDYTYVTPEGNLYLELPSGKYVLEVRAKDYVTLYLDIDSQINSNISLGDVEIYKTSFIPNPDPTPGIDDNFAGGDGSVENPYQIATAAQLNAVRNHMDSHFVLINDIDLSKYNWEPIGGMKDVEAKDGFRGTFDGAGHTVNRLTLNYIIEAPYWQSRSSYNIGLFSIMGDASDIKNLNLKDVNIDISVVSTSFLNGIQIGSIATQANRLINCSASGKINVNVNTEKGDYSFVDIGGIGTKATEVIKCINNININLNGRSQSPQVGGIVSTVEQISDCTNSGYIYINTLEKNITCGGISAIGNEVTRCKNYGEIKAKSSGGGYNDVGGIIGQGKDNEEAPTLIYNANYGNLSCQVIVETYYDASTTSSSVGGIFGSILSSLPSVTVDKCINAGNIDSYCSLGTDGSVSVVAGGIGGGVIGTYESQKQTKIINCYNLCNSITSMYDRPNLSNKGVANLIGGVGGANNFSINTTTLNGSIPTNYIGSMTKAEIEKAIQDLGFELPSELPVAS